MYRTDLLFVLLLAGALLGGESEPANQQIDKQIGKWIADLYSDDATVQDKAAGQLVAIGNKAEVALEFEEQNTEDPDLKLTLARLLAILRDDARDWKWLGEKHGSIFGAELAAKDAFRPWEESSERLDPAQSGQDTVLKWLASVQEPDGYWDSLKHGAAKEADLEQTSWALLAFLARGHTEKVGAYRDNVRRAVAWLISRQRANGAIAPIRARQIDGLAHAVAGLALAEAAGMANVKSTRGAAQRAIEYSLQRHQTPGSGFGREPRSKEPDLFISMFFVMQMRSCKMAGLEVRIDTYSENMITFLESLQTPDGFKLSPEREVSNIASALGCVCKLMLGFSAADLGGLPKKVAKRGRPQGRAYPDDLLCYFNLVCSMYEREDWSALYQPLLKSYELRQTRTCVKPSGIWFTGGNVLSSALSELNLGVRPRWYFKP